MLLLRSDSHAFFQMKLKYAFTDSQNSVKSPREFWPYAIESFDVTCLRFAYVFYQQCDASYIIIIDALAKVYAVVQTM